MSVSMDEWVKKIYIHINISVYKTIYLHIKMYNHIKICNNAHVILAYMNMYLRTYIIGTVTAGLQPKRPGREPNQVAFDNLLERPRSKAGSPLLSYRPSCRRLPPAPYLRPRAEVPLPQQPAGGPEPDPDAGGAQVSLQPPAGRLRPSPWSWSPLSALGPRTLSGRLSSGRLNCAP